MILTVHSCFIVCEKLFFLSWLNPCSNLQVAGLIINVAYSHGCRDSIPSSISCFFFDINYSADVVVTLSGMLWPLVTRNGAKSKFSPEWCCHWKVISTAPFSLFLSLRQAADTTLFNSDTSFLVETFSLLWFCYVVCSQWW